MKRIVKEKVLAFVFLILSSFCFSQTGFEFIQQEITEIIYAVSLTSKTPIICDDTVTGRASFRFAGTDFDTAFESFLLTNRLYVNKSDTVWTVSRIKIEKSDKTEETELYNIDAYDVIPARLFEKLSEKTGKTICNKKNWNKKSKKSSSAPWNWKTSLLRTLTHRRHYLTLAWG